MLRRIILIVLTCPLFLLGCNGDDTGEPNAAPNRPAAKAPHQTDDEPNVAEPDMDEPNEVVVTDPEEIAEPNEPAVPPTTQPAWEKGDFEKALRKVRALEEQARFSQAMREVFAMQKRFRDHPRVDQLKGVLARLRDHREAGAAVVFALRQLTSDVPSERYTAARNISEAGDTGLIYLRKTLRNETGELAVEAARWLGEWNDEKALPLFMEKLTGDPSEKLREVIAASLATWPNALPKDVLRGVLKIVEKDEKFARLKLADTLADALKRQANGEAAEFNKLLGTADAYATLRGYLKRAATSENPAAKALAGKHAGVLGLYRRGLQGEYYRGTSFGKRIMVRLDQSIDFPDGDGSRFKLPEARTEDFSIRWKGQLVVPKDGTYTFVAGSDDGRRVWIDGKQVHSDWTDQGFDSESFEVELSAGLVPIRMEYYQGGGGAGVTLKWKTPDMKQAKTIGPEHLRSKLSETEDAQ